MAQLYSEINCILKYIRNCAPQNNQINQNQNYICLCLMYLQLATYVASKFMAYLSKKFDVTANATTINILHFFVIEREGGRIGNMWAGMC